MSKIIERARELRAVIESAVSSLDDSAALKAVELYPQWAPGMELASGVRVCRGDKLYRVKDGKGHIAAEGWEPEITESLFERVCDTHSGELEDPIPYEGNMVLENGKYYTQGGITYLCTRDTGTAVYHALSELVGLYVEVTV